MNRKGWGLCLSMMGTVGQGQQSVSLGLGGGGPTMKLVPPFPSWTFSSGVQTSKRVPLLWGQPPESCLECSPGWVDLPTVRPYPVWSTSGHSPGTGRGNCRGRTEVREEPSPAGCSPGWGEGAQGSYLSFPPAGSGSALGWKRKLRLCSHGPPPPATSFSREWGRAGQDLPPACLPPQQVEGKLLSC